MDDAEPHAPPRSQHSRRTRLTRCVSARCVALKVHIHRLRNHMKRIAGAEFNTPFRLLALQSCEVMCQIACEYLSKRHETRAGTAAHHMMRAVTIISSAQLTRSFVVDDHPAYSTSWLEACAQAVTASCPSLHQAPASISPTPHRASLAADRAHLSGIVVHNPRRLAYSCRPIQCTSTPVHCRSTHIQQHTTGNGLQRFPLIRNQARCNASANQTANVVKCITPPAHRMATAESVNSPSIA